MYCLLKWHKSQNQDWVVQTWSKAIQQICIRETCCATQLINIYPADSLSTFWTTGARTFSCKFFSTITCICYTIWAFIPNKMTDFPTPSYTWSLKTVPLSSGAFPNRPPWGVPTGKNPRCKMMRGDNYYTQWHRRFWYAFLVIFYILAVNLSTYRPDAIHDKTDRYYYVFFLVMSL